jgi:HD-GYP domain-containing protein (c-di-GMP phosphodiesterase class II)
MVDLLEATRALAKADDLADTLALLAQELTRLFDGSACMISRYDSSREVVTDWAGFVRPPGGLNQIAESYPLDAFPITKAVLYDRSEACIRVGEGAHPEEEELLVRLGYGASLMLPLVERGQAFGLVELFDRRRRRFTAEDRSYARLFVDQAATVLAAARLAETLERQDLAMVGALANALEAKDAYTGHHAGEIGELAAAVGERLGLHGRDLRILRMGGLLHDVGKIGVPEGILKKPGALTDDELELVRRHTLIGARIIEAVPGLAPVVEVVRSSHERWDGAGYPQGLVGHEIPLGARIVAVCDAYHAMTEDRVYRRAMSPEGALSEMRRCAGTQFWTPAVDALEAVIRTGDQLVRYMPDEAAHPAAH